MIELTYVFAGALTGLAIGMTGVGGGALMTPILLLVFGVEPATAIATDLWFAAITKLAGARIHGVAGQIDWQVLRRMWLGSLPVSLSVVIYVGTSAETLKVGWLTDAVGVVVLVTSIGLLLAPSLLNHARSRRLGKPADFKRVQPTLTVMAGGVLGWCVALTSVGAGALGSVALLYLYPLRMTPHRLVATDLVHAIPLALVAGLGYLFLGWVDWALLLSLLLGSIPASLVGAFWAQKLPGRTLQVILAIVLAATGVKVLFS